MQIQLRWTNPVTGLHQQPRLETPVALGRDFTAMPGLMEGQRVSRIVLEDDRVDPFHALIREQAGELQIVDQGSRSGIYINGTRQSIARLSPGDRLQIGPFQIEFSQLDSIDPDLRRSSPGSASWVCDRWIGFLVKRRCGRTNPDGCPYCQNGQGESDPYFYDYSYYPGYHTYSEGHWGDDYYSDRDRYSYDPGTRSVDFTEADSISFRDETEQDYEQDYEQDMGAS